MQDISELRQLLYDMLLVSSNGGDDIKLQQSMGVALTNSVKQDKTVNIIQIQNARFEVIIPKVVEALKFIDTFYSNGKFVQSSSTVRLAELPPVIEDDSDPIDSACEFLYEQHIKWEEMQDIMKHRYLEKICSKFKTNIEVGKFLDMQPSYVSKIKKLHMEGKNASTDGV